MFTKQQKVYFGHIDKAGIVYHPHFIDYFHQAYEDFMEELGFGTSGWREFNLKIPVVNVDVDFVKPMEAGERLTIEVSVTHLGRSSMTFHYRCLDPVGEIVAEGTHTRVTVDEDFEACEIPAEFREALERHTVDR
jgi:YbgC/YbaW family acyl-CoA thioester hydrolase